MIQPRIDQVWRSCHSSAAANLILRGVWYWSVAETMPPNPTCTCLLTWGILSYLISISLPPSKLLLGTCRISRGRPDRVPSRTDSKLLCTIRSMERVHLLCSKCSFIIIIFYRSRLYVVAQVTIQYGRDYIEREREKSTCSSSGIIFRSRRSKITTHRYIDGYIIYLV